MNIRVGDKVQVISGSEKGKQGTVKEVFRKTNKITINDVNMVTKHQKKSQAYPEGARFQKEAAIDASNVMLVDPKTKTPTRIGYTTDKDGVKVRITKKSGTILPNRNK